MKLWEGLEQDINYNAMVSQRGVLNLYHSDASATPTPGAAMRCGCTASTPNCSTATAVRTMRAVSRLRQRPLSHQGRTAAEARRHGPP